MKLPIGMKTRQHRVEVPCCKGHFELFENRNRYDPCWVFLVSDIIESKVLAVGHFEKEDFVHLVQTVSGSQSHVDAFDFYFGILCNLTPMRVTIKALVMETHWTNSVLYRGILYFWTFLLS